MTLGGGYLLPSREGRDIRAIGIGITMKTDGKSTHDAYSMFEYAVPPHTSGPPPHVHTREDESFVCLAGRLDVMLGGENFTIGHGDYLFLPRDVVHTFRNSSDEEARVISVVSPAGLERYYQALAELPEGPPDINAIKEIMADFGLELRHPAPGGLTMRVAVIGAGVAGLATAKVLTQAGHVVRVFDRTPDVGGVWSATRRYPGLTTQSPKAQYALSDFPMPDDYPEWPTGEQVQAWLAAYAEHFALDVRALDRGARGPTRRRAAGSSTSAATTETFDRLVVANGVFCEPAVPDVPRAGRVRRSRAGGSARAPTSTTPRTRAASTCSWSGYGKSACDVTVPISETAASTTVIARQMLWKVPRKVAGVLNFKMLLLTRMGEALFRYLRLRGMEKFLHGPGNGARRQAAQRARHGVGAPVRAARAGAGAAGADGGHRPRRDRPGHRGLLRGRRRGPHRRAPRLHDHAARSRSDGRPVAELSDGTTLPADLVVCATGFTQGVPFLDEAVQGRLLRHPRQLPPLPPDPARWASPGCTSTATTRRSSAR